MVRSFLSVVCGGLALIGAIAPSFAANRTYESNYRTNLLGLSECTILRNNNAQRRIYGASEIPLPSYCGNSQIAQQAPARAPVPAFTYANPNTTAVDVEGVNQTGTNGVTMSDTFAHGGTNFFDTISPDTVKSYAFTNTLDDGRIIVDSPYGGPVQMWISATPGGPPVLSCSAGPRVRVTINVGPSGPCSLSAGGAYYVNILEAGSMTSSNGIQMIVYPD